VFEASNLSCCCQQVRHEIVERELPPPLHEVAAHEAEEAAETEDAEEVHEALMCKICMEFKVDTRLNCGHMLCSKRCAPRVSRCPYCNTPVTERQLTFM
jgi:hypothetical protein